MKHFIIKGTVVAKKNGRVMNRKTGMNFPNPKYVEWHDYAALQLNSQRQGYKTNNHCNIVMVFYWADNMKRDGDNAVTSVFDTLKDSDPFNPIIEDDNRFVVPFHTCFNDYDKDNPRVEVFIYDYDDMQGYLDKFTECLTKYYNPDGFMEIR